MDPREFAAVHRKHHAKVDQPEDPHSPVNHGWAGVLFGGLGLYRIAAKDPKVIDQYGKGLPVDPWENFYQRHRNAGILSFGATLLLILGWHGLVVWVGLMLWIPFWAAGVINGLGHHIGYRNYQTEDRSTNLSPWGVWVGGEELHNNHHAYPASARFSRRPWEFDLGWQVIRVLRALNLAQVRADAGQGADVAVREANAGHPVGLSDFLRDRHEWLDRFHQTMDSHHATMVRLREQGFSSWKKLSRRLDRRERLPTRQRQHLQKVLEEPTLNRLQSLEAELRAFWAVRGLATPATVAAWAEKARELAAHLALPRLEDYAEALSPRARATA
jgi:stearoyl-CoA desaturase (delta-9 desaturase)